MLKFFIGFLLCVFLFLGFSVVKLRSAKAQITEFCNNIHIGAPIAEIMTQARQRGHETSQTISGRILVWDGFAFGRFFCEITHQQDHVTHTKLSFLD